MFRSPFADGVVIIIILLLFFGPKQLPKLTRSIGESARELKKGFTEDTDTKDDAESSDSTAPSETTKK